MVSLIKSKLPYEFDLKLEESREGEWTLEKLRRSIQKYLVAKEKTEIYEERTEEKDARDEGVLAKDFKLKCVFCGMDHYHDECDKYTTIRQRTSCLEGRCYACVSRKHVIRDCKSKKECFHCKRKGHHHSLCPAKFDETIT